MSIIVQLTQISRNLATIQHNSPKGPDYDQQLADLKNIMDRSIFGPIIRLIVSNFNPEHKISREFRDVYATLQPLMHRMLNQYNTPFGCVAYKVYMQEIFETTFQWFNRELVGAYDVGVSIFENVLSTWSKFRNMIRFMINFFTPLNNMSHLQKTPLVNTLTTSTKPSTKPSHFKCLTVIAVEIYCRALITDDRSQLMAYANDRIREVRRGNISFRNSGLSAIYDLLKTFTKTSMSLNVRNIDEYINIPLNIDAMMATIGSSYMTQLRLYCREVMSSLAEMSLEEHVNALGNIIETETMIVDRLLDKRCEPHAMRVILSTLVTESSDRISMNLRRLFDNAIQNQSTNILRGIYCIYRLMDMYSDEVEKVAIRQIAQIYEAYLTEQLSEMVRRLPTSPMTKENEAEFRQQILDYMRSMIRYSSDHTELITTVFEKDPQMVAVYRRLTANRINETLNEHCGTFLQLMVDHVHRLLMGLIPCESRDVMLNECVRVCDFLDFVKDKDMYIETYRHRLTDRLIKKRNDDMIDGERYVLSHLKNIVKSASFTQRCEMMVSDMAQGTQEVVRRMESTYRSMSEKFSPIILTAGSWNVPRSLPSLQIPGEMGQMMTTFQQWWQTQYPNRKLAYIPIWGEVEIKYNVSNTVSYLLQLAPIQAMILMLIPENDNSITLSDMARMLHLENEDHDVVKKAVHSMSMGPPAGRILRRIASGDPATLTMADSVCVDTSFRGRMKKFKIPMASIDERPGSSARNVEADVAKSREIQIEAATVRIMKARRTLSHADLVAEILRQLSQFQPETSMIKRSLEKLIEREFIQRNETGGYNYLA